MYEHLNVISISGELYDGKLLGTVWKRGIFWYKEYIYSSHKG